MRMRRQTLRINQRILIGRIWRPIFTYYSPFKNHIRLLKVFAKFTKSIWKGKFHYQFLFQSPDWLANERGNFNETFKRENPHQPAITYDISQLFDYIDTLTDLSVLVFDKENAGYSPYNKDWIKVINFKGSVHSSKNHNLFSKP